MQRGSREASSSVADLNACQVLSLCEGCAASDVRAVELIQSIIRRMNNESGADSNREGQWLDSYRNQRIAGPGRTGPECLPPRRSTTHGQVESERT